MDQSADSVQVESAHNWLFGRPQRLAEDEVPGSLTDLGVSDVDRADVRAFLICGHLRPMLPGSGAGHFRAVPFRRTIRAWPQTSTGLGTPGRLHGPGGGRGHTVWWLRSPGEPGWAPA